MSITAYIYNASKTYNVTRGNLNVTLQKQLTTLNFRYFAKHHFNIKNFIITELSVKPMSNSTNHNFTQVKPNCVTY
jgi:hypothetical protein